MFKEFFDLLFKTPELKILKPPKTTINGYFGHIDYSTTLIKYKGKKITYHQLTRFLFKHMNFENDPKLIMQMIDDEECKLVFHMENRNRYTDFRNIVNFLENYDFNEYFKDWVKQAEHPEIKNVAWFFAEKGFLFKKKEKNRVYYKFKEYLDYNILFKELFEARKKAIEFEVNRIIDYLADEELEYIKIENSCFDRNLIGVYEKLNTPIFKGCSYVNNYTAKQINSVSKKYNTLKDVLDEIYLKG